MCCAVLCCIAPCWAGLGCAVPCCAMQFCATLRCAVQICAVSCRASMPVNGEASSAVGVHAAWRQLSIEVAGVQPAAVRPVVQRCACLLAADSTAPAPLPAPSQQDTETDDILIAAVAAVCASLSVLAGQRFGLDLSVGGTARWVDPPLQLSSARIAILHREMPLVLARLRTTSSDRPANLPSLVLTCRPGCSSLLSFWCLSLRSRAEVGRTARGGSFPQAAGTQHGLLDSLPAMHCWMAGAMRSMHAGTMLLASQTNVHPPAPQTPEPWPSLASAAWPPA